MMSVCSLILLIVQLGNVVLKLLNWCWIFPLNFYLIILELVLHKMQTYKKIINHIFWFDCITFWEILLLGIIHFKKCFASCIHVNININTKGLGLSTRTQCVAYVHIIGILLHQLAWLLLLQCVGLRDMSTGYLLGFWIFYYTGLHCTLNICESKNKLHPFPCPFIYVCL